MNKKPKFFNRLLTYPFIRFLQIVNPPYLKRPKPTANVLGLPVKPCYTTRDVCKVLNLHPDTLRQRIYRGYYPEYQKVGVKRTFTLDQIMELIKITENLIRKGILSAGNRA